MPTIASPVRTLVLETSNRVFERTVTLDRRQQTGRPIARRSRRRPGPMRNGERSAGALRSACRRPHRVAADRDRRRRTTRRSRSRACACCCRRARCVSITSARSSRPLRRRACRCATLRSRASQQATVRRRFDGAFGIRRECDQRARSDTTRTIFWGVLVLAGRRAPRDPRRLLKGEQSRTVPRERSRAFCETDRR